MRNKTLLSLLLVFILSISFASAQISSINPSEVYYGQEKQFDLIVNNVLDKPKDSIAIELETLTPTSATDFISWTEIIDLNPNSISWNGAVLTDASIGYFRFKARAPTGGLVEETILVPVTLHNTDGTSVEEELEITFLIDDIAPILEDNNIKDGAYILQGIADKEVFVYSYDDQSGLERVEFGHELCSGGSAEIETLTCDEQDLCEGLADFSSYENDDSVCFSYQAYDNAGNTNTIEGTITIDGEAPLITLVSPLDEESVGISTEFSFIYSDNSESNGDCSLEIDGQELGSVNAVSGEESTILADLDGLSDGLYDWTITCVDSVGLSSSETATNGINLDSTAPIITLVDPSEMTLVRDNYAIDIDVTDNVLVSSVEYLLNGQNVAESIALLTGSDSLWEEGTNKLIVTATDASGNIAQEQFLITVDLTAPTVQIDSPSAGEEIDYHVTFLVNLLDNLDSELECQVTSNLGDSEIATLQTEVVQNIDVTLGVGVVEATVTCIDGAGNEGSDQVSFTTIDASGPDISFTDLEIVIRGTVTDVFVTATDYSGVSSVDAQVYGGSLFRLDNVAGTDDFVGSFNSPSVLDEGTYSISYVATDSVGATSDVADDEFELIANRLFNAEIATVEPGQETNIKGRITDDRGELTGEESLGLTLYDGTELVVDIDEEGSFSIEFDSPQESGEYVVTLTLLGSNGYTYEKDVVGTTAFAGGDSPSSGGSRRSPGGIGFWPHGDFDVSIKTPSSGSDSAPEPESSPQESEPQKVEEPQAPQARTPGTVGVGSATEVFDEGTSYVRWLWLLLVLALLAGLYYYSRKRKGNNGGPEMAPVKPEEPGKHDKIFGDN